MKCLHAIGVKGRVSHPVRDSLFIDVQESLEQLALALLEIPCCNQRHFMNLLNLCLENSLTTTFLTTLEGHTIDDQKVSKDFREK